MALFGRTSCEEQRDWQVRIYLVDECWILATEQLNEDEAKEFYNKVNAEFNKPAKTMEVIKDRGMNKSDKTFTIVKDKVTSIEVYRA